MCVGGTPDIPRTPERQAVKQPQTPARAMSQDDERRRRGMLATILTSSQGALTPVATTGGQKEKLG
jgi:hypothetical protein